jgi:putative membrane protein
VAALALHLRPSGVAVLAAAAAGAASAHALDAVEANGLPWPFEPWVLACLALSAGAYAFGLARLWGHAGRGRGVRPARAAAFAAGWLVLAMAMASPLDPLGNRLFVAHMVQHELLMIVAAPLLVLGRPLAVWAWALPFEGRRAVGRFFHRPAWRLPWQLLTGAPMAWLLHAIALWLWHLPALFEAALVDNGVHVLQHLSFLFTALLFWWSVLGATTRQARGIALLSLFTTMVHTGALGALLTLSPGAWYPSYAATAPAFGLTAIEDQQLGGLVMWVPAGLVYVICGLVLAVGWIGGDRPRPARGEAPPARPSLRAHGGATASAVAAADRPRYGRTAAWLHWLIGVALLGQIAFGLLLDDLAPRGTPGRSTVINLHKSFGLVIGAAILLRLAWRIGHALPAWPASMPALQRRAAVLGHRALYACMLVVPLAGYLASNFSRHGVRLFGQHLPPWGPDWPAAYAFLNGLHVAAALLLLALIAGHAAVALWHDRLHPDLGLGRISPFARP